MRNKRKSRIFMFIACCFIKKDTTVSYYPNPVSSFHQIQLVLSCNVQLNPGSVILNSRNSSSSLNAKLKCVLLNNLQEFQGLVHGNSLDVVAVGETWLHDGCLDNELLAADLNTIFRKDRGGKKRSAIIIRRPDLKQQHVRFKLSIFLKLPKT